MTRFVIAPEAEADIADILKYLRREAGPKIAENYRQQIRRKITRLRTFPNSGAPRPEFGDLMRMVVVYPYVLFYEYPSSGDCLTLLRVLHGKVARDESSFGRDQHSP